MHYDLDLPINPKVSPLKATAIAVLLLSGSVYTVDNMVSPVKRETVTVWSYHCNIITLKKLMHIKTRFTTVQANWSTIFVKCNIKCAKDDIKQLLIVTSPTYSFVGWGKIINLGFVCWTIHRPPLLIFSQKIALVYKGYMWHMKICTPENVHSQML